MMQHINAQVIDCLPCFTNHPGPLDSYVIEASLDQSNFNCLPQLSLFYKS